MKRSEMVKQISIELLDIFKENYMEQMGEGWCANLILLRLEELGMLPPSVRDGAGGISEYWEPEDVQ